jgi:cytochrome bd-type quinol oxidase subunit 2
MKYGIPAQWLRHGVPAWALGTVVLALAHFPRTVPSREMLPLMCRFSTSAALQVLVVRAAFAIRTLLVPICLLLEALAQAKVVSSGTQLKNR